MSIRRRISTRYAEFVAQIDIDTLEIIKGSLPRPQLGMVKEWALPRRRVLRAAWDVCRGDGDPGRIE